MIAVHINKINTIQSGYTSEIANQYAMAYAALLQLYKTTIKPEDKRYVLKVCWLFRKHPDIVTAHPDKLDSFFKEVGPVPKVEYDAKSRGGGTHKRKKNSQIWKSIVEALNYEGLRDSFYPKYFGMLGIKACVYCNSQYTLTVEKKNGAIAAKYDVDHYRSKSNNPWCCISLFNLYPSCVPCNRAKKNSPIAFRLYSDIVSEVRQSGFRFTLHPKAKANYLITNDSNEIRFSFGHVSGNDDHDKMFSISGIYATQLDLAEELIISSQMYDKASRNSLTENFKKLHITQEVFNRFILGTYAEEVNIHRRPMSKFTQDIARDLGILKSFDI